MHQNQFPPPMHAQNIYQPLQANPTGPQVISGSGHFTGNTKSSNPVNYHTTQPSQNYQPAKKQPSKAIKIINPNTKEEVTMDKNPTATDNNSTSSSSNTQPSQVSSKKDVAAEFQSKVQVALNPSENHRPNAIISTPNSDDTRTNNDNAGINGDTVSSNFDTKATLSEPASSLGPSQESTKSHDSPKSEPADIPTVTTPPESDSKLSGEVKTLPVKVEPLSSSDNTCSVKSIETDTKPLVVSTSTSETVVIKTNSPKNEKSENVDKEEKPLVCLHKCCLDNVMYALFICIKVLVVVAFISLNMFI